MDEDMVKWAQCMLFSFRLKLKEVLLYNLRPLHGVACARAARVLANSRIRTFISGWWPGHHVSKYLCGEFRHWKWGFSTKFCIFPPQLYFGCSRINFGKLFKPTSFQEPPCLQSLLCFSGAHSHLNGFFLPCRQRPNWFHVSVKVYSPQEPSFLKRKFCFFNEMSEFGEVENK